MTGVVLVMRMCVENEYKCFCFRFFLTPFEKSHTFQMVQAVSNILDDSNKAVMQDGCNR